MIVSDVIGWGVAFVWIGVGVIVASGLVETLGSGPYMKKLAESEVGLTSSDRSTMWWYSAAHLLLLSFAVWAMVAKPGL